MDLCKIIKMTFPTEKREQPTRVSPTPPPNTFLQDIYFTANFHAKAKEWRLTEDHARLVYYEGDPVQGKENMKVMTYQGEEIGVYVFHDRQTNQPVVTSIWKRTPRAKARRRSARGAGTDAL